MDFRLFLSLLSVYLTGGASVDPPEEIVLLHDLNSDHERRHLDAGLPSRLVFNVQRKAGDQVKLTLEENKRLNRNVPLYKIQQGLEGKRKLVKQEVSSDKLQKERYYRDKENGGVFAVSCELDTNGPCRRMLTGNFYFDGRNYDISPLPKEIHIKRHLELSATATPHVIVENDMTRKQFRRSDVISSTGKKKRNLQRETLDDMKNKRLQNVFKNTGNRQKRDTNEYDIGIVLVMDFFMYNRFYHLASPTENLTREDVTLHNLKRHAVLLVDGVSLRYETIDDPDFNIFCTLSDILIAEKRDESFPLPKQVGKRKNGLYATDSEKYIYDLIEWLDTFEDLPEQTDHLMVITGLDLYTHVEENSTLLDFGVLGMSPIGQVCQEERVSVSEDHGSFFESIITLAHELGHNMGAEHDGEGDSSECDPESLYIMYAGTAIFGETDKFTIQPWRFSRCSVKAFKAYIDSLESDSCLTDEGELYNEEAYKKHTEKLPGEQHDLDDQCRLIQGENSKLCEETDLSNICLVMKCLTPDGQCRDYTAARGTPCGFDKWCMEGGCIPKTQDEENEDGCKDIGYGDFSCAVLKRRYSDMSEFCHTWRNRCCKTCLTCWNKTESSQYDGIVSWTKHGRKCQYWSSQEPHEHSYDNDSYFPIDGSVDEARNFCRDPDGDGFLWCFTINAEIPRENCDIPVCNVDCYFPDAPEQYRGTKAHLSDGTLCMAWSEQTPHEHVVLNKTDFPSDVSVNKAHNYCRSVGGEDAPWCFPMDASKLPNYCDVPKC